MSIMSSSSPNEISQSPLNNSPSKALYSFPKEKRFREVDQKLCQNLYDLPSTKDTRCTSFGYGQKVGLARNTCSPAPSQYKIQSEFEIHRGFSLGLGRESVQFGCAFDNKLSKIPGPGTYNKPQLLSPISYTMRQRTTTEEEKSIAISKQRPGPCSYPNPLSLNGNGKYPNSTFKNSSVWAIHQETGSPKKVIISPGPGTYNQPETITATGKQSISRFKSSGACTFALSGRSSLVSKSAAFSPAPGAYRIPSEFGYYEKTGADNLASTSPKS